MTDRLYVAVKAPRVGFAKTRLARAIGTDAAIDLYRGFLLDLSARLTKACLPVGWFITPDDAWPEIAPFVHQRNEPPVILEQGEGDWTQRQQRLFQGMSARQENRVLLMSSDSPHIDAAILADAFEKLNHHDVVIGPVTDGGYYMVGMRASHDVLAGVRMSTSTVYEQILFNARIQGLRVGISPETFDIDEGDDLRWLLPLADEANDLKATRAVLDRYGLLSRTEVA